jgi:hypothetical protein
MPEDDIGYFAIFVRHAHRHDNSAVGHGAYFHTVGIGQGVQIDRPPIPGFPKCFFPNLAFTLCRGGILPRCGGDKE